MSTNRSWSSSSVKKQLPSSSSRHGFQVVVMRVCLHCLDCAHQIKKLLLQMEGVTSLSIELETNRVIVMGHVSPVQVLESISKFKTAEFWSLDSQNK